MSTEAEQRKEASHAILRSAGIAINRALPCLETEAETTRRPVEAVASRAIGLCLVATRAERPPPELFGRIVDNYGARADFTPNELAFIDDPEPADRDCIQFSWRYEGYWVMLWALGYVESLAAPTGQCDLQIAIPMLQQRSRGDFIADAELRSQAEILDAADLTYRYHWAVRDASINPGTAIGELDAAVVIERHHALNWLIVFGNQPWDNVTTDT